MSVREHDKEKRFITIYQAYIDEIYQFIFARSGFEPTIAEDITQDIFIDVLNGLDRFRGLCSERTWIYKIARNKLNDHYRRQYRQNIDVCAIDEAEPVADSAQNIELQMEKTFENRFVRGCLDKLPIQYRLALIMKYVNDLSIKQMAEIAGKSPKAMESMLHRAKDAFIKEYKSSREREER